ncbi:MAG: class I SAM-dependent methyltransferase [Betaproteobacteria bacterium]|jgi:demethylmenaquinone methyltransferase / 2-methoxy-6-polyprenyl-1,4-benzoquinol methylase|nr:class I SAM-dependent methyltransferase [Betaproteobacteria bacterium]NBP38817.1 class I SAM-dependent methyltransferase [Betaproteobacteria bacterium]NBQ77343.1 class I SAM-dependent methyltransferase [Betaproteobacteria bacterium]NBS38080.1 class I SAM-dependent methyltransferase [Betaproteobacteria bacterium]NCY06078.1 class I SAM-dependent methyltransferase [Betaproteobacteria bacterium]
MADQTDFGFSKVNRHEKAARVAGVFDSVAPRYDLMNDLMSGGLHRLWKHAAVFFADLREGMEVLDVAGGTADLAVSMAKRVGDQGHVVLSDINGAMLSRGRDRMIDAGLMASAIQCDAEALPFESDRFDRVTVAFGLRNMTHKDKALGEMRRVLRPGGKLLVLEFSKVHPSLEKLYDLYSFQVLPRLGRLVAGDEASYRYLAESIRMHPDQESLAALMRELGFQSVRYTNLTGGVVALHEGTKA